MRTHRLRLRIRHRKIHRIKHRRSKKKSLRGRSVRKSIEGFYARKKHMSKKKARYIAGAVAHNEHKARKRRRR